MQELELQFTRNSTSNCRLLVPHLHHLGMVSNRIEDSRDCLTAYICSTALSLLPFSGRRTSPLRTWKAEQTDLRPAPLPKGTWFFLRGCYLFQASTAPPSDTSFTCEDMANQRKSRQPACPCLAQSQEHTHSTATSCMVTGRTLRPSLATKQLRNAEGTSRPSPDRLMPSCRCR